jgi:hypothetical protein
MHLQSGKMVSWYILNDCGGDKGFMSWGTVPHSLLIRRSRACGEFGGESELSFTAVLSRDPSTPLPAKGSSPSREAANGSSVDWLMVGLSMAVRVLVSHFPWQTVLRC